MALNSYKVYLDEFDVGLTTAYHNRIFSHLKQTLSHKTLQNLLVPFTVVDQSN
jgi:Zn-dependent M32 family carboxypeptidase